MGITLESIKNKMIGKSFGKLTVKKYVGKSERGDNLWRCICTCGTEVVGRTASVDKPHSACTDCKRSSSAKAEQARTHLLGKSFGRLTVVGCDGADANQMIKWRCRCNCGNEVSVRTGSLISGVTQSCGCYARERAGAANRRHGLSAHPLYGIYWAMKERCYNQKCHAYPDYGARGIKICSEWLNDFMAFFRWAMDEGYCQGLTIERVNNHGNYEPGNCRWATQHEQVQNTRRTRLSSDQVQAIRLDSRTHKVIAKEYKVDESTISRVKANRTWYNIG